MKANRCVFILLVLLWNGCSQQSSIPTEKDSAGINKAESRVSPREELSVQRNPTDRKLLEEIKGKAERGDAHCQWELGRIFFRGSLGVAKDEVAAVKWFRKAAEQNLAEA